MRVLLVFTLLTLGSPLLPAQTQGGAEVEGLQGQIEIRTVGDRSGTLIRLDPVDRANPVLLVLQYGQKGRFLPEWTGYGKLFLSHGMVAIVAKDGTRRMAEFANLPVPESIARFAPENYEIVGIARYGVFSRLSEAQIANLRAFGLSAVQAGAPEKRRGADTQLDYDEEGCNGVVCTSGGHGSTSCSVGAGGCSVTCSAGYYACCSANTNNGRCCKYKSE